MGRHHNPEFTMLWVGYRPHYDMYRLMNEVDDLLQQVLDCQPAEVSPINRRFGVSRLTRYPVRIKRNCVRRRQSLI